MKQQSVNSVRKYASKTTIFCLAHKVSLHLHGLTRHSSILAAREYNINSSHKTIYFKGTPTHTYN